MLTVAFVTKKLTHLARARRLALTGEGRQIREAAGVSLRELAAAINPPVSQATLQRWETGSSRPTPEHALAWARALARLARVNSEGAAS